MLEPVIVNGAQIQCFQPIYVSRALSPLKTNIAQVDQCSCVAPVTCIPGINRHMSFGQGIITVSQHLTNRIKICQYRPDRILFRRTGIWIAFVHVRINPVDLVL